MSNSPAVSRPYKLGISMAKVQIPFKPAAIDHGMDSQYAFKTA